MIGLPIRYIGGRCRRFYGPLGGCASSDSGHHHPNGATYSTTNPMGRAGGTRGQPPDRAQAEARRPSRAPQRRHREGLDVEASSRIDIVACSVLEKDLSGHVEPFEDLLGLGGHVLPGSSGPEAGAASPERPFACTRGSRQIRTSGHLSWLRPDAGGWCHSLDLGVRRSGGPIGAFAGDVAEPAPGLRTREASVRVVAVDVDPPSADSDKLWSFLPSRLGEAGRHGVTDLNA